MNVRELSDKEKLEVAICEALDLNPKKTSRLILDFDAREPLIMVYAEMTAAHDEPSLLDLGWVRGLAGADITVVGAE